MDTPANEFRLSPASAARYSLYLRCLEERVRMGCRTISSKQIAEAMGIRADAQVRKDLAPLGGMGRAGIGYPIHDLITAIREALGIHRRWIAVLVGAGNLARALVRYQGFRDQGFDIAGLFDNDPSKVGTEIEQLHVFAIAQLPERIKSSRAEIGIITVPAEAAQAVADVLVEAGIRGILNFAPTVLRLPSEVRLTNVDLSIQLEQLAYQIQHGSG